MGAASLTAPAPGDTTALDDYDQHGRILGAPPDEAMDQAARAYVARYLAGRDVILTAADWARCRELSTRIRDDLIHLGLIDGGRSVRIAEGADASAGDLIICRQNDHAIQAGEPDRALANGDILRIEAITGTASWSAVLSILTLPLGGGVSPPRRSPIRATSPVTWHTPSLGTRRKAAQCTPG